MINITVELNIQIYKNVCTYKRAEKCYLWNFDCGKSRKLLICNLKKTCDATRQVPK